MTGREIRTWARERVRGQRGILLLAGFLVSAPSLLVIVAKKVFAFVVPLWGTIPISFLSMLLLFGYMKLALDLAADRPGRLSSLGFSFSDGMFGKAAVLALFLSLVTFLINFVLHLLSRSSKLELLFLALGINLILLVLYNTITFPIGYRLVLFPRDGAAKQLKEGSTLGFHQFWEIFVFQFCLFMPLFGLLLCMYLIMLLLSFSLWAAFGGMTIVLIAFIGFACWYVPYVVFANAAFARGMLQSERAEPPKTVVRTMRLYAGGGGWYWCPMNRGPAWTNRPVCRRYEKKG